MPRSEVVRPAVRSTVAIGALAVLAAVEGIQGYGISLFTPEIAATLKVGVATVVSARAFGFILGSLVPLVVPSVGAARRQQVRGWVCRGSAVLGAAVLVMSGMVTSTPGLVLVVCLAALVGAPFSAVHRALVIDIAAEGYLVRALSALQVGVLLGQAGLALAVATGGVTSWSSALEVLGYVGIAAAVMASLGLRVTATDDPPHTPGAEADGWKEVTRAWRATPSLLGIGAMLLVIGLLQLPFDALLSIYLHDRWDLSSRGVGTVFLTLAAASVTAVLLTASRADRRLNQDSCRVAAQTWRMVMAGAVLLVAGAYSPSRVLMVGLIACGSAAVCSVVPLLAAVALTVVPRTQRGALAAAIASILAAGGLGGVLYAISFDNRHGARSALVAMSALAVIAAVVWRSLSRSLVTDQQRVLDAAAEQDRHQREHSRGGSVPLLACRGINFSYGSLHVLFDVDFTIDEGEVVALLGTNGAGKSTLLKVISGIELPQRGAVRLAGRDITYLDAEDRVRAGITQVAGGHAVFGSMTVVENLQSFGYTLGRNRRTVDEAIERCLAAFPQLASRRSSLAATLSGGEQQMVALSKALILEPKLLLIDELSLGLAPVVIRPLLDMVRRINSAGTAVVIVEQSVNVALSLVDHAYFMEKGSIRFDGRAQDLLDRHDLLRAVFLEGAAKAVLA